MKSEIRSFLQNKIPDISEEYITNAYMLCDSLLPDIHPHLSRDFHRIGRISIHDHLVFQAANGFHDVVETHLSDFEILDGPTTILEDFQRNRTDFCQTFVAKRESYNQNLAELFTRALLGDDDDEKELSERGRLKKASRMEALYLKGNTPIFEGFEKANDLLPNALQIIARVNEGKAVSEISLQKFRNAMASQVETEANFILNLIDNHHNDYMETLRSGVTLNRKHDLDSKFSAIIYPDQNYSYVISIDTFREQVAKIRPDYLSDGDFGKVVNLYVQKLQIQQPDKILAQHEASLLDKEIREIINAATVTPVDDEWGAEHRSVQDFHKEITTRKTPFQHAVGHIDQLGALMGYNLG